MMPKATQRAKSFRSAWSILIVASAMLLLAGQSYAQDRSEVRAIVQETQKMSDTPGEMTIVWWLPEQFWRASLPQGPAAPSEARVEQFFTVLRRYTLIAVVSGRMGVFGGVTFMSEEAVRASVTVKDAAGTTYAPLGESSIDPDMKNLLQMMKPVVANMVGPIGQNIHFFLFPSKSDDGRPIADAMSHGALYVSVGEKEFKYGLPLVSLLPPRFDSSTGERFPGNYSYNPFTGHKLVAESPNKPLQPTH